MRTPHQTLGLQPDASEEQIKAAYRRLVLLCHPDRCQEPEAAKWFNDVTVAYRELLASVPHPKPEDIAPKQTAEQGKPSPNDLHLIVWLPPADLRDGCQKRIRFSRLDICPICGGNQRLSNCAQCNGAGTVAVKATVMVRFPAGMNDGSVLRLRGAGHMGGERRRGDVWVRVRLLA
jgi:DnaJ-class molecular chaperone